MEKLATEGGAAEARLCFAADGRSQMQSIFRRGRSVALNEFRTMIDQLHAMADYLSVTELTEKMLEMTRISRRAAAGKNVGSERSAGEHR